MRLNQVQSVDQGGDLKPTVAQIVWEMLSPEGVEVVFGIPGGAIMDTYHHLGDYDIRHVLVRHEQGAAHAADGYARASGRIGVAIATSGPGVTNLITCIATAMLDSSPIVCIEGQTPTSLIGSDAFQEADITSTEANAGCLAVTGRIATSWWPAPRHTTSLSTG